MSAVRSTDQRFVEWLSRFGSAPECVLAVVFEVSERSARSRLQSLERAGLVHARRILAGEPPLYAITRAGLRAAGAATLEPPRLSASNAAHHAQCAIVAAVLSGAMRDTHTVHGERELRVWERAAGGPIASAEVGLDADGRPALHRPDLVCLPLDGGRPRAIEVELTVKAPLRLRQIVRGWARSRLVSEVTYYAVPGVDRAVSRAVALEAAEQRVRVVALPALQRTVAEFHHKRRVTSPHAGEPLARS